MSLEANKEVVEQYVDAFNRADVDALQELFTEDALIYGVLGWGELKIALPIWRELHHAFELRLEVQCMAAEGDVVAVRYVERGRSVGEFRGLQPTGKSYEIVAMEWFEIKDGKIHRRWGARDSAALFRQMGLPLA